MGVAQRREREREQLRALIVEAARDLLLEHGLAALSMRAIAERIEYSPATIYLYFKDKEELIGAVVHEAFERLSGVVTREIEQSGVEKASEQYFAMGRAYARFAVENPAYFRVMFELPATAELCQPSRTGVPETGLERAEDLVRRAVGEGQLCVPDAHRTAIVGWGLVHGLTTLYLSGHLRDEVGGPDEFIGLIEDAMRSVYDGWRPAAAGEEAI